jgi:iron complex transport system ATP-binding protein
MQLKLTDVSVNLSGKSIIEGLSIEIEGPCFFSVSGPNGSGKTTLLRAIADLILFDGAIASTPNHISLCLQEHEATNSLEVKELLLMGRYARKELLKAYGAEDISQVSFWAERMGIVHLLDEDVMELSGGQRKMVYLTLALISNEGILLLDEPTQYLDVKHKENLAITIRELVADGQIVVCVSHDQEFISQFRADSAFKEWSNQIA